MQLIYCIKLNLLHYTLIPERKLQYYQNLTATLDHLSKLFLSYVQEVEKLQNYQEQPQI